MIYIIGGLFILCIMGCIGIICYAQGRMDGEKEAENRLDDLIQERQEEQKHDDQDIFCA